VVLALPRGGVAIGFEIARALDAPLDTVLVHKIGVPWQPELALGAVTDGAASSSFIDQALATRLDICEDYVRTETERQLQEIERRRNSYCADRPPIEIAGRTAIVADDGIATGATMGSPCTRCRGGTLLGWSWPCPWRRRICSIHSGRKPMESSASRCRRDSARLAPTTAIFIS
jgi:predicted phosphoribosyltransferase